MSSLLTRRITSDIIRFPIPRVFILSPILRVYFLSWSILQLSILYITTLLIRKSILNHLLKILNCTVAFTIDRWIADPFNRSIFEPPKRKSTVRSAESLSRGRKLNFLFILRYIANRPFRRLSIIARVDDPRSRVISMPGAPWNGIPLGRDKNPAGAHYNRAKIKERVRRWGSRREFSLILSRVAAATRSGKLDSFREAGSISPKSIVL